MNSFKADDKGFTGLEAAIVLIAFVAGSASTADTNFVTLLNGATAVTTMSGGDQVEIRFNLTAVPKDTKVNIEMRPGVGAALPFSKTTPPAITANNVLF